MTMQESRRSTRVVRPDEDKPLGSIGSRVKDGVGSWLKSPALDFYGLIVVGALLIGVGLVMVLSASSVVNIAKGQSGFAGLFRQGTYAVVGLVLLVVAAVLPPGFYRRAAWPLFGLGLLLQCLVHTPLGIGKDGNTNWILIGGQTLQPSEFLKLALAVWLGAVLATKQKLLNQPFHLAVPMVPGVIAALGLVLSGHDLGTALVMAMLVAGAVWVAGAPRRWFALAAGLGLVGVIALTVTSANRMHRIMNWLTGTCDGDSCYQSDQGLAALAGGGWWGVGPGESRLKWGLLPAAQDDYIFAIIGEELGLFGTLGVLALFTVLALFMFRMITRIDDRFQQITVAGISCWLLGQAFVNMMGVTGLLPVLGVPLPFISSGGSALISSMVALGILLSFARREPGAQEAIGARIGVVRRSTSVLPAPRDASRPARSGGRRGKAGGRKGTAKRAARTSAAGAGPARNAARSSSTPRSRSRKGHR